MYSVTTPRLGYMALGSLAVGLVMALVADFVPVKILFLVICGIGAVALLQMSGRITGDRAGLEIQRPWLRKRVNWDEIVEFTYQGGNWVFTARGGVRMVIPGPFFWSRTQKPELLELIESTMASQHITPRRSPRAAWQSEK